MKQILVVNVGSSSLKYAVVDPSSGEQKLAGIVERIGLDVPDHATAFAMVREQLEGLSGLHLAAVGHRVVHGGADFSAPVVITPEVIEAIESFAQLAPLHNPPALVGIAAATDAFPTIPQVAVFDTAFHATIPPAGSTYALDREVAERYRLRRYGFHGTSHQYVCQRAAEFLDEPVADLRMVTLHLGNGASACAIDGGRSVDTSMGVTPLEGLVMGTRTGDLDPAIPLILERAGWSADELDALLNRASGLKGLCGSNDLREIHAAAEAGEEAAELARQVTARRILKYVGAYAAVLGGLDVLVFTAGIGEHDAWMRARVCESLGFLGIELDEDANLQAIGPQTSVDIGTTASAVKVLVVPTDEEHSIAEQAAEVVGLNE